MSCIGMPCIPSVGRGRRSLVARPQLEVESKFHPSFIQVSPEWHAGRARALQNLDQVAAPQFTDAEMHGVTSTLRRTALSGGSGNVVSTTTAAASTAHAPAAPRPVHERLLTCFSDALARPLVDQVDREFLLSPLMLACQWKWLNQLKGEHAFSPQTVQLLLDRRSDPNLVRPDTKVTALFFAVKYADLRTVEILLAGGAILSARDHVGRTALVSAVERSLPGVVPLLLSKGLDAREEVDEHVKVNAAELMIISDENAFTSWQNMGPPDKDAYVLGFKQLMQAGATLGGQAREVALLFRNSTLVLEDPSVRRFQKCMLTDYKFTLVREAFPCLPSPIRALAEPEMLMRF